MDQTTRKALQFLKKIKSVSFATVNNNEPAVRIADVMLVAEDGLYFLTARGKPFYRQLMDNQRLAICGMDENYITVRIVGEIQRCEDRNILDKIFQHNPMMNDLYPGEKRQILESFHMHRGKGEIFDLSIEPPERERFSFGGERINPSGYRITDNCTACGACLDACPVGVIYHEEVYKIDGFHCLECGACAEVCPENAIEAAKGI